MQHSDSCYAEFIGYICPFGDEKLQFLLYGMREKYTRPLRAPDLSGWPHGTTLTSFVLTDEHWPVVVELFEFWSASFPQHCEELLIASLSDVPAQGALLSWYMFEGTLNDIAHVFTPWAIERTYGVALSGQASRLALTRVARQQQSWRALLENMADALYQKYPELHTGVGDGHETRSP